MKARILAIFLACVTILVSSFCAGQMKLNTARREMQKLERNYQNQRYTLETLRKNVDLVKKALDALERKVAILESKANKNSKDILQIQSIRRGLVELKKLLLEFKKRYLR